MARPRVNDYFSNPATGGSVKSVIEEGLNACYIAQPPNPAEFMADHIRVNQSTPVVERVECHEVFDACVFSAGTQGFGTNLACRIITHCGLVESAVTSHSYSIGRHPTSIRRSQNMHDALLDRLEALSNDPELVHDFTPKPALSYQPSQAPLETARRGADKGDKDKVGENLIIDPTPRETVRAPTMTKLAERVVTALSQTLRSCSVPDLSEMDCALQQADGTGERWLGVGANVAAAFSIAAAKAAAAFCRQPLFAYLRSCYERSSIHQQYYRVSQLKKDPSAMPYRVPMPMMTLFGTEPRLFGRGALRLREVLICPLNDNITVKEGIQMCFDVFSVALTRIATLPPPEEKEKGKKGNEGKVNQLSEKNLGSCITGPPALAEGEILMPLEAVHSGGFHTPVSLPPTNADGSLRLPHYLIHQWCSLSSFVEWVEDCIKEANLVPGVDIGIGLVPDSSWLCINGNEISHRQENIQASPPAQDSTPAASYDRPSSSRAATFHYTPISDQFNSAEMSGAQLADMFASLCLSHKSIVYLEDTHHCWDHGEMRRLMSRLGNRVFLVGAHLYSGNTEVLLTANPHHQYMTANNNSTDLSSAMANQNAADKAAFGSTAPPPLPLTNALGVRLNDSGTLTSLFDFIHCFHHQMRQYSILSQQFQQHSPFALHKQAAEEFSAADGGNSSTTATSAARRVNGTTGVGKSGSASAAATRCDGRAVIIIGESTCENNAAVLAHVAVAVGSKFFRCGGMFRSHSMDGYNELIQIEHIMLKNGMDASEVGKHEVEAEKKMTSHSPTCEAVHSGISNVFANLILPSLPSGVTEICSANEIETKDKKSKKKK